MHKATEDRISDWKYSAVLTVVLLLPIMGTTAFLLLSDFFSVPFPDSSKSTGSSRMAM